MPIQRKHPTHRWILTSLLAFFIVAPATRAPAAGRESPGPSVPPVQLTMEGRMASQSGATGWLNSTPLAPADLHGKVV
jgi:hypothetical protein